MTAPRSFSPTDCSNLTVLSMESSNVDFKTVGFFIKNSKEIGKSWRKSLTRANRASVSPQSCSLFSASFHTFRLTARAYLNTQKYGLFCSLVLM